MKARPIIFSGPMVRAILKGRKRCTRRIVKPQPCGDTLRIFDAAYDWAIGDDGNLHCLTAGDHGYEPTGTRFPYGTPGDLLWVKETWQTHCDMDGMSPKDLKPGTPVQYPATYDHWVSKRRSSMFMPRWASRLTLRIESVKVERVQDITPEDVFAEGLQRCIYRHGSTPHIVFCDDGPDVFVPDPVMPAGGRVHPPVAAFAETWNRINGPGSWDANPFCWCISFSVVKGAQP